MDSILRAPPIGRRPGSLVIVGSGIKSFCHFTLEAQAQLRRADRIYYCVADPATELWITEQRPDAVDLYEWYDDDKPRRDTYAQMTELMLAAVRQGLRVVGVFYGHPGVFVNPAHRAIIMARQEGHAAVMLPGVSAQDCLFADLGVDPSMPGCQTLEATDLLLRGRTVLTDAHVVIFQVGCVGDMGFNFKGFRNSKLPVLIERLVELYGPEHEAVHYVAAQYPISDPTIERYRLKELSDPEIAKRISGISTLYLPPKDQRPGDSAMAQRLGLRLLPGALETGKPRAQPPATFSEKEQRAVDAIPDHVRPGNYRPARASGALYAAVGRLFLDPVLQEEFARDPAATLDRIAPDLPAADRAALLTRHPGVIRLAMQRDAKVAAEAFVREAVGRPSLAMRYGATLRSSVGLPDGAERLAAWLRKEGYDTDADEVRAAYDGMRARELGMWTSHYCLTVEGGGTSELAVGAAGVTLDGAAIVDWRYEGGTLSWNAEDNASAAVLRFSLPACEGEPSGDAYIGPYVSGEIWQPDVARPERPNAWGKVGTLAGGADMDPRAPDPLNAWNQAYRAYARREDGWVPAGDLSVTGQGSASVLLFGTKLAGWTFRQNTLSWSAGGANETSGTLTFVWNPLAGVAQVIGCTWRPGEQPPPRPNLFGHAGATEDVASSAAGAESLAMWRSVGSHLCFLSGVVDWGGAVHAASRALATLLDARLDGSAPEKLHALEDEEKKARLHAGIAARRVDAMGEQERELSLANKPKDPKPHPKPHPPPQLVHADVHIDVHVDIHNNEHQSAAEAAEAEAAEVDAAEVVEVEIV